MFLPILHKEPPSISSLLMCIGIMLRYILLDTLVALFSLSLFGVHQGSSGHLGIQKKRRGHHFLVPPEGKLCSNNYSDWN